MKVELAELKKAVTWLEGHTKDLYVFVDTYADKELTLSAFDRDGKEVVITIYAEGLLKAKIKRTDLL